MNARQLLSRFSGVRKISGGWMVPCPSHEDVNPSLKIAEGDGGKAILYCHAGCQTAQIVGALGLQMSDLFPDAPPPAQTVPKMQAKPGKPQGHAVYKGEAKIVATYDYTDVDGALLYQVVRKEPKNFIQRRPDGEGGWIYKVAKQVKRVPYRLDSLQAEPIVWIVEGEKDADRLWNHGLPATCNAGGAGKWGASESKALAAACVERVIVLPDNDEAGHKHANEVASKCKKVGLGVSVIELPEQPHHGDVSDWLNSGHTVDELKALAAIPYVLPSGAKPATPQGYSGPVTGVAGGSAPTPEIASGMVEVGPPAQAGPDALPEPTKYGSPHGNGSPNDVGAAEAFRDRYGHRVRYDHTQGRWYLWTGHYWKPDAVAQVYQLAIQHVRLWQAEAAASLHYPKREGLCNFLMKLDKKQGIDNMLTCATWLAPIATDGRLWDRDGMLFGMNNGVLDLKTGSLIAGAPEQFISQIAPFDYDSQATAPRWKQFMQEVFEEDHSLITYVQRALGYSMTADMREQVFFLCVGGGSNGKSIFLDTLEYIFGSYAHRANMRLFVGEGAEKFHLAELEGRRLIVASETKQNTRINEHVMKNFTGGETQSAERKHGRPFTFTPIGKIWMGANHEPKVTDDSYGFWRRVRLIPFLRTFQGTTDDRNLRDKLRAEAPGILQWCVEGCLDWQEFGLPAPAKVMDATTKYQQQENPLAEFFAERCIMDPDDSVTTSALIASYTTWCDEQGIRAYDRMPRRAILTLLEKQFLIINVSGVNRVKGLRLMTTGHLF